MKKDIEWLKEEVFELYPNYDEMYVSPDYETVAKTETISKVLELIDQLDGLETLSQEWIDDHKVARINNLRKMTTSDVVLVEKLENLLVPKKNKPVIPQFVADYIERAKPRHDSLYQAMEERAGEEVNEWVQAFYNSDKFARAWLGGYEVEKEPVYFAKIKGHELVGTETILDEDTGDDISEFCRNIYFVLQRNGELVVDMKDSGLSGAKHVMTMKQWNDLGINETNADFEEVTP